MSLTLAVGRPTLLDHVFARRLATDVVLVVSGAAVVSLAAQFTVPLPFVPITGQTLAVLLVGSALGASRGALSLVLYAVLGLVGLPVFAPSDDGSHLVGVAAFTHSSGGYIIGFIAAAAVTGWLAQRAWDHRWLGALAAFGLGTAVTFLFGTVWLAFWLGHHGYPDDLVTVLSLGVLPFIPGSVIKAALAAVIVRGAWSAVRRADGRSAS